MLRVVLVLHLLAFCMATQSQNQFYLNFINSVMFYRSLFSKLLPFHILTGGCSQQTGPLPATCCCLKRMWGETSKSQGVLTCRPYFRYLRTWLVTGLGKAWFDFDSFDYLCTMESSPTMNSSDLSAGLLFFYIVMFLNQLKHNVMAIIT